MNEKIIKRDALEGYKADSGRYGAYIIRRRAIPSVKDGLKLVHRRILFSMLNYDKAIDHRVKAATVVGSVLGKLHPHGDSSVYGAMVNLNNFFTINYPLLDGQGNWGNIRGDSPAAMRYTETRVSKFGYDVLLSELRETYNVVDWIENFANTDKEPEELPAKLPLLLINGSSGIAQGLKCDIPPNNLGEVVDETLKLINNPNHHVVIPPDQCLPCEIVETNWKAMCNTGKGGFIVRGIIDIGTFEGKPAVFIRSTPDQVTLNSITDKLNDLIAAKKLPQVHDMIYTGSDDELEFTIILKKGADPNYVRDYIYKSTSMQTTQSVDFQAIDDKGEPIRLSYTSYLQYFIEFRKETKFRLYCNRLQSVRTKMHEMDAYIKVLQSGQVDEIIHMIRTRKEADDNSIIEYLVTSLHITDMQAAFIINSPIKKLSQGYLNKYIADFNEYLSAENRFIEMITNDNLIVEEIVQELKELKKKYNQPRKCNIISEAALNNIPEGEFKVIITQNNFVKKLALNDSVGYLKDDAVKLILKVQNTDNLIIFAGNGKVFKLPVHKIPLCDRSINAIDIRTLAKNLVADIIKVVPESRILSLSKRMNKFFLVSLTKQGNIKKLDLEDFLTVPLSGIVFHKVDDGDVIQDVNVVPIGLDVIVYSSNTALRMNESEIPHQKRNTKGVKSILEGLTDGLSIVYPDTTCIVVVTNAGYINKISIVAMPNLGRNKMGSSVIKLGKGDFIREVFTCNKNQVLKLITKNNKLEFKVDELPESSSVAKGTKVITKTDNIIKCKVYDIK